MTPYYEDDAVTLYLCGNTRRADRARGRQARSTGSARVVVPTWRILVGDVREKLRELPDGTVQCVVTSPPYWGLRNYGVDGQIGLESSPEEYVETLVGIFRDVRRILKDNGTLWLNLGDSYNGYMANQRASSISANNQHARPVFESGHGRRTKTLKQKNLVGIPWRVALALQADGWYLRCDIIWAKPNHMPESVKDRPTRSHEYVFLLSKRERYYYDADAISEPAVSMAAQIEHEYTGLGLKEYEAAGVQNPSSVKARIIRNARAKHRQTDPQSAGHRIIDNVARARSEGAPHDAPFGITKNCRSVWTIKTQPSPDAHFATFPEALPERCIKAGSRIGDVVADPFCGSGTTGQIAIQLGRSFIGVELKPEYAELATVRIAGAAPLFAVQADS